MKRAIITFLELGQVHFHCYDMNTYTYSAMSYPTRPHITRRNSLYQVAPTTSTSTINHWTASIDLDQKGGALDCLCSVCVCCKHALTIVYGFLYRTTNRTYVNMVHYLSSRGAWPAAYVNLIQFIMHSVHKIFM